MAVASVVAQQLKRHFKREVPKWAPCISDLSLRFAQTIVSALNLCCRRRIEQRGCCVEDRPLVGRVHDRYEPHFGAPKYQRLKIRCARIVPTLSIKGERTTGRHYIMTPSASEGWA